MGIVRINLIFQCQSKKKNSLEQEDSSNNKIGDSPNDNNYESPKIFEFNIINNKEIKNNNNSNFVLCEYVISKKALENFVQLLNCFEQTEKVQTNFEGIDNGKELKDNIEIYINDKKVTFCYNYKSEEKGEIKVKFKFKKLITSTHDMFNFCSSLKSIDFSYFNSSQIEDIGFMFCGCSSLKSIDLSPLDTSKVTNMNGLFYKCTSLESINLSSFNTSNVINMNNMFGNCKSLKSIDLSIFNTKNVNDMGFMFVKCSALTSLDLSSFDISNCCNIMAIIANCSSLDKDKIRIKNFRIRILDELKKINELF